MSGESRLSDVFITHAATEQKLAEHLARTVKASGLNAVTGHELLGAGDNLGDKIWEALAESMALIVVVSRSELTSTVAFEIGAARAWNKPIFVVLADPAESVTLPAALTRSPIYPPGRVEDLVKAIKNSSQSLTEEERDTLASLYFKIDLSVDQLALNPVELEELVKGFSTATGRVISGERLLSELLRMRKQGGLRKSPARRASPKRTETA
jgi:hypothetical protein